MFAFALKTGGKRSRLKKNLSLSATNLQKCFYNSNI